MLLKHLVRFPSVLLLVCVIGCSSGPKVTLANFEKIKDEMTLPEVESILGRGVEQPMAGGGAPNVLGAAPPKKIVWQDGDKSIIILFSNDKVLSKEKKGF